MDSDFKVKRKYEIVEVDPHRMVFTCQLMSKDDIMRDEWEGGSVLESTGMVFDSYAEAQEKSKELYRIGNNPYTDFLILSIGDTNNWEEKFKQYWTKANKNRDEFEGPFIDTSDLDNTDSDLFKSRGFAEIYFSSRRLFWDQRITKQELKEIENMCKK